MHPVLLQLSLFGHSIPIHSYGFVLGWALFFAAQTALHFGQRDGLSRVSLVAFSVGVIALGFAGARLLWIFSDDANVHSISEVFTARYDGLTFYGGAIAGTLAAYPVARLLRLPVLRIMDAGGPAVAIALGLGRFGCFLYGCDYGLVASGPWRWLGVSFPGPTAAWPAGSPAWQDQVRAHLIARDAPASLPVIPTQLIEATVVLSLAAALWVYLERRPRQGSVILAFYLVYGLARALMELLRGDAGRGMLLGVSTSTAIGLLTASGALVALAAPPLVRMRPRRDPAPEGSTPRSRAH